MSIGSSSNPAMKDSYFEEAAIYTDGDTMTIDGVIHKTALLVFIAIFGASIGWKLALSSGGGYSSLVMPGIIIGFALALITCFKPEVAPYTSIPYALAEGVSLGVISAIFNQMYGGIAINALLITFSVLFLMLTLYRTGIITATGALMRVVYLATSGVCMAYLLSIGAHAMGFGVPMHATGGWGIIISLGLCIVAAFNFITDFEVARRGAEMGAPKYMEWYASFGILVTIIWLYLEVLKLLARSRRR